MKRSKSKKKATAPPPEHIDQVLLLQYQKAAIAAELLQERQKSAVGAMNEAGRRIAEHHKLGDRDEVDLVTGVITRAPPAATPAPKEA